MNRSNCAARHGRLRATAAALLTTVGLFVSDAMAADPGYTIPLVDLSRQTHRQVIVDREPGQYLGHVTTVLLEDGKTILCVYPKGHGRGAIVMKRSTDGGRTWSDRLPTPENWATSQEVPTIHRVVDPQGRKRLILWSGRYPARLAVSEDDGQTWTGLRKVGDWGGIVVMGFVEPLATGPGHYLAMFHDDGQYLHADGKQGSTFTLYKTFSRDGGLNWSTPEAVWKSTEMNLCEPGCFRSPDGRQLAVLLRENLRRRNAHVIFSNDEGQTWTEPRELPGSLTGDRHTGRYAPDGRLFISFRDTTLRSPTHGDWVGWVGTHEDIVQGREGQYRVRLMKNRHAQDCAYSGVEILPDGTFVTTTYGHWMKKEKPYIVSVRFKLDELDAKAAKRRSHDAARDATTAPPANVDLRPQLDELDLGPRRQGRRPTCSVFTTAAAIEFALAKHRGKGVELSVEYLNWACNQILGGEPRNHGQFFHNLLEAFRQHGICHESDMPYRRRFDPGVQPSPEAIARAKRIGCLPFQTHWINPLKSHGGLTDDQFREIKSVLARGWPVAAGSHHSRLLVGYRDDAGEPGGGVFLTKDSGSGSYSQVSYEFVMKEVADVFWVEWPA